MSSSRNWKNRQESDPYVRRARDGGYRARSAFKLLELDDKYGLLRPGQVVVDLGAAPGGWCQVARSRVGSRGKVIGLDLLPMDPIEGVAFIEGDFREDEVLHQLEALLDGQKVDLVLSDMAPNISGVGPADQARSMYLAELALDFARQWLNPAGGFVVKVFQGAGFDEFHAATKQVFRTVRIRKPPASRKASREVYIVATGCLVE